MFLNGSKPQSELALEDMDIESTEGISKEDQQDIREQIEQVAAANRIAVTPQLFSYHALKKGSIFPVVINLLAILALGGGLTVMAYLFRQNENRITGQDATITTAEGEILQEVRREATQQIQQKDQEINNIQARLKTIDAERSQLQQNMDSRVQAREAELRKQMEAALAAERARLQSQGVSETEITRRINEMQAAQTAQFNAQMEQFRRQAEEERSRLADNLQKLESEYRTNLAKATQDRAKILEDSQKRISDLQAQLQGQIAQSQAQLSQAQSQLAALRDASQKEQLAAAQITGFYTTVRDDVNNNNYNDALATLSSLKDYLSSDAVLQLAPIRERRPAELFIINSLSTLIEQQSQQNTQDAQGLIAAASIVDQAKSLASQADQKLAQGDKQAAEELYGRALALVPGIAASHQYFMERDAAQIDELKKQVAALQEQQQTLTANSGDLQKRLQNELAQNQALVRRAQEDQATRQAAQAKLQNALDQARRLYAAGSYRQSLDQYRLALTYLPVGDTLVGTTVDQIAAAGYRVQSAATAAAATDAAAPLLRRAQELYSGGKYAEALDAYAQLIRTYPLANQVPAALSGMRTAYTDQINSLQNRISSLTQERDRLNGQVSSLQAAQRQSAGGTAAQIDTLTTQNKQLTDQVAGLQNQIDTLQKAQSSLQEKLNQSERQLAAARQAAGSAAASSGTPGGTGTASTQPQGPVMDAATQQELARLRTVNQQYNAMQKAYSDYAGAENQLLGPPPSGSVANAPLPPQSSLLRGKVLLDKFLSSEAVQSLFPSLLDRIRQYDRGFEASGRTTALSDMSDLVYNLSQLPTPSDRRSFIQQQIAATSDADMKSFLQELSGFVTGG
ncbi:hypothetical protein [Salinispira pacifica]